MQNKVFAVPANESFFQMVANYIAIQKTNLIHLVVPTCADSHLAQEELSKHQKQINLISFENYDKFTISSTKRIFLFAQLINSWNIQHQDNIPFSISYELVKLFNEMHDHGIPLIKLGEAFDGELTQHQQKTGNFLRYIVENWNSEGNIDSLELRNINELLSSWNGLPENELVIFSGMSYSQTCIKLIKAIYQLAQGRIILPNCNPAMICKTFDKHHYQYHINKLLNDLKITHVEMLGKNKVNNLVESIFSDSLSLASITEQELSKIQIIYCSSYEEEAQIISSLTKQKTQLFCTNDLLLSALAARGSINEASTNVYLSVTFLLYIIDVVVTNYGTIELLTLLKHPFFPRNDDLISRFEIDIIRGYPESRAADIQLRVNNYSLEMANWWQEFVSKIDNFRAHIQKSLGQLVDLHLQSASALTSSPLDQTVLDFMQQAQNMIKDIDIYGIATYQEFIGAMLYRQFIKIRPRPVKLASIIPEKVVFADFCTLFTRNSSLISEAVRAKIELPTKEESEGYHAYSLYGIFHSPRVYITTTDRNNNWLKKIAIIHKIKSFLPKQVISDKKNTIQIPCSPPNPQPPLAARMAAFSQLSAAAVELLIQDPYVFYSKHILKLLALPNIYEFKPQQELSNVLHKVLAQYFSPSQKKHILEIINSEFNHHNCYKNYILWHKLQKMASEAVEEILTRRTGVQQTKRKLIWKITEQIEIITKSDLIEHRSDDTIAVIDYKIGKLPTHNDIVNGIAIHLILQAITAEHQLAKKVSEVAYWSINTKEIKYQIIKNHNEIMISVERELKALLNRYLNENLPFNALIKSNQKNKYIEYQPLKRMSEWMYKFNQNNSH